MGEDVTCRLVVLIVMADAGSLPLRRFTPGVAVCVAVDDTPTENTRTGRPAG